MALTVKVVSVRNLILNDENIYGPEAEVQLTPCCSSEQKENEEKFYKLRLCEGDKLYRVVVDPKPEIKCTKRPPTTIKEVTRVSVPDIVCCRDADPKTNPVKFPSYLGKLFKTVKPKVCHEACVIAVHVLMTEMNFVLTDDGGSKMAFEKTQWKTAPDIYRLYYCHPRYEGFICRLTFLASIDKLSIHGIIEKGDWVKAFQYDQHDSGIIQSPLTSQELDKVFINLPKMSKQFKDGIGMPMLAAIHEASDNNKVAGHNFMSIPTEMQVKILTFLDCASLGKMSQVSKHCKMISEDPLPWRTIALSNPGPLKYFANFGIKLEDINNFCAVDWKLFCRRTKPPVHGASNVRQPIMQFPFGLQPIPNQQGHIQQQPHFVLNYNPIPAGGIPAELQAGVFNFHPQMFPRPVNQNLRAPQQHPPQQGPQHPNAQRPQPN